MKTKLLFAAVAAALFAGPAMSAQFTLDPSSISVPAAAAPGTQVTVGLNYDNANTQAFTYQADIVWDVNQLTYVSHTGSGCTHPQPQMVRTVQVDISTTPLPSAETCVVTLELNADNNGTPWADGDVINIDIDNEEIADMTGDVTASDLDPSVGAVVTLVNQGPPTIDIDTTPISLSGTFGSTQSDDIVVTVTDNGTADPADTAEYSCTVDNPFFTIDPATGGPIQNGDSLVDIEVSAVLGADAETGVVTCEITDSAGGSTTVTIDVDASAGTMGPPELDPTPADGSTITVGGGAPGTNGSTTLAVAPNGGMGSGAAAEATVDCSAAAPVTISPTGPQTFDPNDGPLNFTIEVPLTNDPENYPGAITCTGDDANGPINWTFDVSAPAGVVAAAPNFVPASSLWSKIAMFGIFAVLGALVLGSRRNS